MFLHVTDIHVEVAQVNIEDISINVAQDDHQNKRDLISSGTFNVCVYVYICFLVGVCISLHGHMDLLTSEGITSFLCVPLKKITYRTSFSVYIDISI